MSKDLALGGPLITELFWSNFEYGFHIGNVLISFADIQLFFYSRLWYQHDSYVMRYKVTNL